jgi:hypothetical protein
MKTVKIQCFSAINGEKTFVWNGYGDWNERDQIRFLADADDYAFAYTKDSATFLRLGTTPLEIRARKEGRSEAWLVVDGRRLHLKIHVYDLEIASRRLDIFFRMEEHPDAHQIHLDWTIEGRNPNQ